MAEQKAKPAAKKVAAAKTSSKITGKPKTATAPLTKSAKLLPAKKTVAAKPHKSKVAEVKKAAAPAVTKQAAAKIPRATRIRPESAKPKPAVTRKTAKPTPDERYHMVETAAYFIAERHGFQGRSDEYWVAAEREIAARLGQ